MTDMALRSCDRDRQGFTANSTAACWIPWVAVALLLVSNVPLFLCMPLTDDAAMYDLQALNWLRGGVLYRDILEPNLPGVIWIQAVVRATLGSSSLSLRGVDLLLFSVFAALSRHWLASSGATRAAQAWLVFVLFVCYFSLSEWCHCQRDVWLLVPGLAGLTLRRRQIERLRTAPPQFTQARSASEGESRPARLRVGLVSTATVGWAFLEGLCWGAGVCLKPMIVLPAVCCWAVSVLYVRSWRRIWVDFGGLLLGGVVAGVLGVVWLVWSGAWPYFLATLREWNPGYVAAARAQWTWTRYVAMHVRFFPWQLLHLAAVPIAAATIVRAGTGRWKSRKVEKSKSKKAGESESRTGASSGSSTFRPFDFSTLYLPLLSVFYLAWLVQSYLLQHLFDYVHVPAMLLAIVVTGAWRAGKSAVVAPDANDGDSGCEPAVRTTEKTRRYGWRFAVAGFAVLVLLTTPVLNLRRLAWWPACITEGSAVQVRDGLKTFSVPSWQDLERVAGFLREQGIREGELTCYNSSLVHLYGIMGLGASTRYVYLEQLVAYFPDRRAEFLRALSASRQRYVVTDLIASGLSPAGIVRLCNEGRLERAPRLPSRLRDVYPWSQPAVFRAGPYLVHRVERPLGRLEGPRTPP